MLMLEKIVISYWYDFCRFTDIAFHNFEWIGFKIKLLRNFL